MVRTRVSKDMLKHTRNARQLAKSTLLALVPNLPHVVLCIGVIGHDWTIMPLLMALTPRYGVGSGRANSAWVRLVPLALLSDITQMVCLKSLVISRIG